jgi:hypothetical protein
VDAGLWRLLQAEVAHVARVFEMKGKRTWGRRPS